MSHSPAGLWASFFSIHPVLNINGNPHLLEKEVVRAADSVLSQSLQLCEFHHREFAAGLFP